VRQTNAVEMRTNWRGETSMALSQVAVEVFCSYAHEDENYRQQLETHLSALKRQGLISLWHDRLIMPGSHWTHTIDRHVESASVIILLISADFLASDYCYNVEMKRALERHEANEARVIPIIVRPCDWQHLPIGQLLALPTDAKPISTLKSVDKGWQQVAAGLRRVIKDLSLLSASAPRTTFPPIWMIPYPRNPFFTGRDELLTHLHTLLHKEQRGTSGQIQAISGLGGIGKTQIAIEYAYRYRQDYQVVLWGRAESIEGLNASYSEFAKQLNLPLKFAKQLNLPLKETQRRKEAQEQEKIIAQAVKSWLHTHQKWLLILDNADKPELLRDFLPPGIAGHILLTTRITDLAGLGLGLAHPIKVELFSLKEGILFLLHRSNLLDLNKLLNQAMLHDRAIAKKIVQEMGRLPLALDLAGAFIAATPSTLIEYLDIYHHNHTRLLQQQSHLDYPKSLATTWNISFEQVESKNHAATELLQLCAYFASAPIPERIITKGSLYLGSDLSPVAADAFLLTQTIKALRDYSLIDRNPQTQVLSVHPLVQTVLRDNMDAELEKQWKQRAVQAVSAASPDVEDVEQWDDCEQWVPHVLECATWIRDEQLYNEENASLLNKAGYYLDDRARYSEAEVLYQLALTIRVQVLGATHHETTSSLTNLGLLYRNQEKYAEAESLLKRAWKICGPWLTTEHLDTARVNQAALTLNNLALLYDDQEKYAEAEPLYVRVLAICEQQLGAEHLTTALILNNLGSHYVRQKKYAEAEPLLKRALAIREPVRSQHPDMAQTLNNLATLYEKQEKYTEAEPLLKRSLTIYKQKLGPEHPTTKGRIEKYMLLLQKIEGNAEVEVREES
jgi:Tfp pilus assembly protein PilF